MLRWHPANTKPAVLAVQHLIGSHPYKVDFRNVYYFVTRDEVLKELSMEADRVSTEDVIELFKKNGIENDQIYDQGLRGADTYGYFVTEKVLREAGAQL